LVYVLKNKRKLHFSPQTISRFGSSLQTINPWTLAPQTIKKFQKDSFYRNMPIIPLSHVIFQLKIKNKFKNIYIKKKMGLVGYPHWPKWGWPIFIIIIII
jgi:hypothetical protein